VEILGPGNTREEMDRKLRDYFSAGVRLVWYVDPAARNVRVYTAADKVEVLDQSRSLNGGDVLPGFSLPVQELFARAER
jgi:Uma2 family endonuclease